MASIEGIIFSNIFITNREMFVDFFEQFYKERAAEIEPAIIKVDQVLTTYTVKSLTATMAEEFKEAWNNFSNKELLRGDDLQLLVAYRGPGGLNASFSKIIQQSAVEGTEMTQYGQRYGIRAGDDLIRDSMKALKASQIERFLQLHLNDFLNQLNSSISQDEAYKIHKYHTDFLTDYYKYNDDAHLTGTKFREAFYTNSDGFYFGGQGLGQAYDAFMNHIANKNQWVYDYLRSGGNSNPNLEVDSVPESTVYVEEGQVYKGANFPRLLSNSRNNTGWYTGGDIVIVNPETMQIVYNIQLKTTTENKASVFGERVSNIRTFIKSFIKGTPRQKGEILFDFFLTSVSNEDDFNNMPDKQKDQIIQENLKNILNKKIQVTAIKV